MKIFSTSFLLIALALTGCHQQPQTEWDVFSPQEKRIFSRVRTHWETWVPARQKDGTAPLMTFTELYEGLDEEGKHLLDRIRAIKPSNLDAGAAADFQKIENQTFEKDGKTQTIGPQYLPHSVYKAYVKMMESMQQDIGKKLLVESGYRAPAYQLYTFLFYHPKHNYSLKETRMWVALPGHSEHGNPQRQAIDFINEKGVNGDMQPEAFEALEEYRWLQKYAHEFGFVLSYPRGTKDTTFEPWHWRYEGNQSS